MTTNGNAVQAYMAKANLSSFYDPNDPLNSVYANLVAQYQTTPGNPLIESCLRARQIFYWKNTPGDCPKQSSVAGGVGPQVAKSGLLAAGTLTSLASAGVFGGAAGATGFAAEVSSIAVSGAFAAATAGIGLALVPVFMILAHHKAAVAKEQATLCEISAFATQGFQAVAAANVDWKTRQQYFTQIASQALGSADSIKKTCNAACVYEGAIKALRDLYIQIYAQAPAAAPLLGISSGPAQNGGPTATNSQYGGIVDNPLVKIAAEAGGAALGAHFLGVF